MSEKRGLGRGFDALIPTDVAVVREATQLSGDSIAQIEVSKITPNPNQPRAHFDQDALNGLADSIRQHGVIQPLVVTKVSGDYQLIAGERRLRAAKLAGLKRVPVIVRSMDEQNTLEVALVENLQRADLNPIETALVYRKLTSEFNLSVEEIAKRAGQAKPTVFNIIRLLNLPTEVQAMIRSGQLPSGHARAVLMIKDPVKQIDAAKLVVAKGLTARQAEHLARTINQADSPKPIRKDSESNQLTEGLSNYLKTKVSIQPTAKGGRLVIQYASDDDLDRIYKAIRSSS